MNEMRKKEVKTMARKLYRGGRITWNMVIWAMRNAGYTEEETELYILPEGITEKDEKKSC